MSERGELECGVADCDEGHAVLNRAQLLDVDHYERDNLNHNFTFHLGERDADIARQRCSEHNFELEFAERSGRRPYLSTRAKWVHSG